MQALAIVPAVAGGVWSVLQPGLDPFSDEKDAELGPVVYGYLLFFLGGGIKKLATRFNRDFFKALLRIPSLNQSIRTSWFMSGFWILLPLLSWIMTDTVLRSPTTQVPGW